jgi:hypothetical protein
VSGFEGKRGELDLSRSEYVLLCSNIKLGKELNILSLFEIIFKILTAKFL